MTTHPFDIGADDPVLAAYGSAIIDILTEEECAELVDAGTFVIPEGIYEGTPKARSFLSLRRAMLIADATVRQVLPLAFDTNMAWVLQDLPPIVGEGTAEKARIILANITRPTIAHVGATRSAVRALERVANAAHIRSVSMAQSEKVALSAKNAARNQNPGESATRLAAAALARSSSRNASRSIDESVKSVIQAARCARSVTRMVSRMVSRKPVIEAVAAAFRAAIEVK